MKKTQGKIYFFWIILSFVICSFLIINLYPNYINNEFPLYTDFTLLLFLPAFFIFSYLLSHLLSIVLSNTKTLSDNLILFIQSSFIFISFVVSLNFMEFRLGFRIIISIISLIISMPHFIVTKILYNKTL